jgi:hypothetical protein
MSSQQFPMQEYCKIDKTKNFYTSKQVGLTKGFKEALTNDDLITLVIAYIARSNF